MYRPTITIDAPRADQGHPQPTPATIDVEVVTEYGPVEEQITPATVQYAQERIVGAAFRPGLNPAAATEVTMIRSVVGVERRLTAVLQGGLALPLNRLGFVA